MNENVGAIIAPDEAVAFRIIKPFHGSSHFAFPPHRGFEIFVGRRQPDSSSTDTMTNGAECSRIEVRVKRTFYFYSKDKFLFILYKNDSVKSAPG
jgi:hypothetical protein